MADFVMVNSKFTAGTFRETFTSLEDVPVNVLYPGINKKSFDIDVDQGILDGIVPPTSKFTFLSINRYERKKNLVLALEALNEYRKRVEEETWKETHLIMAGKYKYIHQYHQPSSSSSLSSP